MKKVQLFENYISEAAKFDVDVEEPFSERDEKKAISKFKIVAQPITILEVEGDIGENETAVEIKFSNDDVLQYTYSARNNRSPYKLKIISGNNGSDLNFSDEVEDYLGSTGSVIGDRCTCLECSFEKLTSDRRIAPLWTIICLLIRTRLSQWEFVYV